MEAINFKIITHCSLLTLFLVGWGQNSIAQDLIILSNASDWEVSDSYDGPWRTPVNQSNIKCHDPDYIKDQCGSYPSPNNKLELCSGALPIWGGLDPNDDCYWPPGNYFFKTSFYIPHSAEIDSIKGNMAVDNFFNIFINDNKAGDHGTGSERWAIDFDLTESEHSHINIVPHLKKGLNTIVVQAWNVHGGSCFNYAFLVFCLKFYGIGFDQNENCLEVDDIVVYPNPADFNFYIKLNCEKEVRALRIYDGVGQSLIHYNTHQELYKIESATLAAGVYLIEILYSDGTAKTKKVNITH